MELEVIFLFLYEGLHAAHGYDDKKQEGQLILVLRDIVRMVAVEENSITRANRHVIYQFGNFSNQINCIFI